MGLDWLWLGHAPKTTAGQHYTSPTPTILDKCLARLHDIIFDSFYISHKGTKDTKELTAV